MKIILIKNVPKVGLKHDIKDVSDGYALNLLIPRGLAEVATPGNLKKMEVLKAKEEGEKKAKEAEIAKNLGEIAKIKIEMKGKANEKGHLFAGITKEMIAEELAKTGHSSIHSDFIVLDKHIKEVGEHDIAIKVLDKVGKLKLVVSAL